MKTFKLNSETKIDTGFTTPENYFENFASKILLEIKEKYSYEKNKMLED